MSFKHIAGGYLVKDNKVLLVHNKKLNKWTPPGGHIEENETPDSALIREWKEELDLDISILAAHDSAFAGDTNATPIPMPFHIDLEREGFDSPRLAYFFYVQLLEADQIINILESELHDVGWFSEEDLHSLSTFDQVRALARHAIKNYPR